MPKTKVSEITDLIKIRDFLQNTIHGYNHDKATINKLTKISKNIDQKVLSMVISPDFTDQLIVEDESL